MCALTVYRLIDPGSEWRLHREWFDHSAMAELLGTDFSIAEKDTLYRCLDKILPYKKALYGYLQNRWQELFGAEFDILLYDLTSTYFETGSKTSTLKQFGYSRDKRSDCSQVVIALIVTPRGFPLSYEVMPGNTSDNTTLRQFLKRIEDQYGKARRLWVMDRGIPTQEVLGEMNAAGVQYIVGTPKAKLTKLQAKFVEQPWVKVKDSVKVKMIAEDNEIYILARSNNRVFRDKDIRKFRLKRLLARLKELQAIKLSRDQLLLRIGAAKKEAGRIYSLLNIKLPKSSEKVNAKTFSFQLNKDKFRLLLRQEGAYLLRSNITNKSPQDLWSMYTQLTEVEEAFKNLKGDLAIRPIFHQTDQRIEAHIFVAFLAYCLHVTLKNKAKQSAPGLTPRSILEQLKAICMLDVHIPTTDGRFLLMSRYTQPDKTQQLLLAQLALTLPEQPPPKIHAIH